ncbi:hypothetical protein ACHAWF_011233 [Thalassiosira exigua]
MTDNNAPFPAPAAPAPAPAPAAPATFGDVMAAAGVELYSLLTPRDLCSLSMSNRAFRMDVRKNILLLCSRAAESSNPECPSDCETQTSVVISNQHSFTSRVDLAECLLEKTKLANLRYEPLGFSSGPSPDTLETTLTMARKDLGDQSRWYDSSWYGNFKDDPAAIWKPKRKPFTIGCRFEDKLLEGRNRQCFIDWTLQKLGQEYPEANQPARDWGRFLAAQRGLMGREWHWEFDGEEGLGFMIYSMAGGPQLEIRMIKKACQEAINPPPTTDLLSFLSL